VKEKYIAMVMRLLGEGLSLPDATKSAGKKYPLDTVERAMALLVISEKMPPRVWERAPSVVPEEVLSVAQAKPVLSVAGWWSNKD
tara:strand:- start:1849 stop:2103 length:255 start_codon:yes stop_codon:yes gene_type:complete